MLLYVYFVYHLSYLYIFNCFLVFVYCIRHIASIFDYVQTLSIINKYPSCKHTRWQALLHTCLYSLAFDSEWYPAPTWKQQKENPTDFNISFEYDQNIAVD